MNNLRPTLFALVLAPLVGVGCTKDLRPPGLHDLGSPESARRGRSLLEETLEAHGGGQAWLTKKTTTTSVRDTWQGMLGALANPWPDASAAVTMHFINGGMDSRAVFAQGSRSGETWGRLQDGRTYTIDRHGKLSFTNNKDARFILAALHYLNELPFRLAREAPQLAYVDSIHLHGRQYERILGTWGISLRPSSEYDQYLLYIDADTKRLAKVFYTVRDFARFAAGCMNYDDYRVVDGIAFPFLQTVTEQCDQKDYLSSNLHQVRVSKVNYNVFDPDRLRLPRP